MPRDEESEELCVEVVEARNLPSLTNALSGGRGPRLYLVLRLGKQVASTRLVKASKSPRWNETFVFRVQRKWEQGEEEDREAGDHAHGHVGKEQERLSIDLYSSDAQLDRAEAHKTSTVIGDGPSPSSLSPRRDGEAEAHTALSPSIPMPIRSLGRAVVSLASEDAAPIPRLPDGSQAPLEFLDIIPRSGQARASGIPLFSLGQLGVKIFLAAEGLVEEPQASPPPPLMPSLPPMLSPPPLDAAAAEGKGGEVESQKEEPAAAGPERKEIGEGGRGELAEGPAISNVWQPPASVDWDSIARTLEREERPRAETPRRRGMHDRFSKGGRQLCPALSSPPPPVRTRRKRLPHREAGSPGTLWARALVLVAILLGSAALLAATAGLRERAAARLRHRLSALAAECAARRPDFGLVWLRFQDSLSVALSPKRIMIHRHRPWYRQDVPGIVWNFLVGLIARFRTLVIVPLAQGSHVAQPEASGSHEMVLPAGLVALPYSVKDGL